MQFRPFRLICVIALSTAALFVPATAAFAATAIANGDFESGTLTGWTSTGTTAVVNSGAHGGTYAELFELQAAGYR